MANWVRYPPPPFLSVSPLGEHAKWRCDAPPQKGYLRDTGAIPYENKAKGCDTPLCDTISKRYCAIWGGISHWAAKAKLSTLSLMEWPFKLRKWVFWGFTPRSLRGWDLKVRSSRACSRPRIQEMPFVKILPHAFAYRSSQIITGSLVGLNFRSLVVAPPLNQQLGKSAKTISSTSVTVRVKIITGGLVNLENFPKITVTVTVLNFGWITITVTVLAPAVAPWFPLTPNYRLESHLS